MSEEEKERLLAEAVRALVVYMPREVFAFLVERELRRWIAENVKEIE